MEGLRSRKMAAACGHFQGQVESPSRPHVSIFGEQIRLSECVRVFLCTLTLFQSDRGPVNPVIPGSDFFDEKKS